MHPIENSGMRLQYQIFEPKYKACNRSKISELVDEVRLELMQKQDEEIQSFFGKSLTNFIHVPCDLWNIRGNFGAYISNIDENWSKVIRMFDAPEFRANDHSGEWHKRVFVSRGYDMIIFDITTKWISKDL